MLSPHDPLRHRPGHGVLVFCLPDRPPDDRRCLRNDCVSEALKAVHPEGSPISHVTNATERRGLFPPSPGPIRERITAPGRLRRPAWLGGNVLFPPS